MTREGVRKVAFDHLQVRFDRGLAGGDHFLCTVKIQNADMAKIRRNQEVRRGSPISRARAIRSWKMLNEFRITDVIPGAVSWRWPNS